MSNRPKDKANNQPQMSNDEMIQALLKENAMLRQQLGDKNTYETIEQLKIFVDIAKSNVFKGDKHLYILSKIEEVVFPRVEEPVEEPAAETTEA